MTVEKDKEKKAERKKSSKGKEKWGKETSTFFQNPPTICCNNKYEIDSHSLFTLSTVMGN
jgi:hypothetical protein